MVEWMDLAFCVSAFLLGRTGMTSPRKNDRHQELTWTLQCGAKTG